MMTNTERQRRYRAKRALQRAVSRALECGVDVCAVLNVTPIAVTDVDERQLCFEQMALADGTLEIISA